MVKWEGGSVCSMDGISQTCVIKQPVPPHPPQPGHTRRRYRVVVEREDGSQAWAALPVAGAQVFHEDYMGGGTMGGTWRAKRLPDEPLAVPEYGYNQVGFHTPGTRVL